MQNVIYRNVGLECFFYLPKFLLLSLVFAYIYILQGSVETHLLCHVIITLLQIICKVCQWKNYENRSIIGEDIDKSKVARFLVYGVVASHFSSMTMWVKNLLSLPTFSKIYILKTKNF